MNIVKNQNLANPSIGSMRVVECKGLFFVQKYEECYLGDDISYDWFFVTKNLFWKRDFLDADKAKDFIERKEAKNKVYRVVA